MRCRRISDLLYAALQRRHQLCGFGDPANCAPHSPNVLDHVAEAMRAKSQHVRSFEALIHFRAHGPADITQILRDHQDRFLSDRLLWRAAVSCGVVLLRTPARQAHHRELRDFWRIVTPRTHACELRLRSQRVDKLRGRRQQ